MLHFIWIQKKKTVVSMTQRRVKPKRVDEKLNELEKVTNG